MPLFVAGFCLMVGVNTWLPLPVLALHAAGRMETLLLSAAMFALGCGVRVRELRRSARRPVALAAAATVAVTTIAFTGTFLVG